MICKFFDRTLKRHQIAGKKLSEVTGISQAHISEFRHGKTNPSCETLMLLLDGVEQLDPQARQYFCLLLAGRTRSPLVSVIESMNSELTPAQSLSTLLLAIDSMSNDELTQLLLAIAQKLRQPEKSFAPRELISA